MNNIILLQESEEEENFLSNVQETLEINGAGANPVQLSRLTTNNILIPKNLNNMTELTFRKSRDTSGTDELKPPFQKTNSDELSNKPKIQSQFKSVNTSKIIEKPTTTNDAERLFKKTSSGDTKLESQTLVHSEYDSLQTHLMAELLEEDKVDIQSIMSQTREMLSSKIAGSARSNLKALQGNYSKKSGSLLSNNILSGKLSDSKCKSDQG